MKNNGKFIRIPLLKVYENPGCFWHFCVGGVRLDPPQYTESMPPKFQNSPHPTMRQQLEALFESAPWENSIRMTLETLEISGPKKREFWAKGSSHPGPSIFSVEHLDSNSALGNGIRNIYVWDVSLSLYFCMSPVTLKTPWKYPSIYVRWCWLSLHFINSDRDLVQTKNYITVIDWRIPSLKLTYSSPLKMVVSNKNLQTSRGGPYIFRGYVVYP